MKTWEVDNVNYLIAKIRYLERDAKYYYSVGQIDVAEKMLVRAKNIEIRVSQIVGLNGCGVYG